MSRQQRVSIFKMVVYMLLTVLHKELKFIKVITLKLRRLEVINSILLKLRA